MSMIILASLPPERQAAMQAVRKVILENLPEGYQETMDWGMISYEIPLEIYPDTYNKKPIGMWRLHHRRITWLCIL